MRVLSPPRPARGCVLPGSADYFGERRSRQASWRAGCLFIRGVSGSLALFLRTLPSLNRATARCPAVEPGTWRVKPCLTTCAADLDVNGTSGSAESVPGSNQVDKFLQLPAVERGRLYVVATPIGNLGDLSFRALAILRQADWIAAEDTRHTGKLLSHYGISMRKQVAHHEHNWREQVPFLLSELQERRAAVALVCDAGTPLVADPGTQLVREAIQRNIPVVSVPGPCAALAALTISGFLSTPNSGPVSAEDWAALLGNSFSFYGFLPHRSSGHSRWRQKRTQLMETIIREAWYRPVILYEAPHRLRETVHDLALAARSVHVTAAEATTVQPPDASLQICIARELTKVHEEVYRGLLREAAAYLEQREPRGEYCLVLGPPSRPEDPPHALHFRTEDQDVVPVVEASAAAPHSIDARMERVHVVTFITALLQEGLPASAVARCVARSIPNIQRKQAYALVLQIQEQFGNCISKHRSPGKEDSS